MTKISGSTTYYKKVFPTIWFGFLALFAIQILFFGDGSRIMLIGPVFMSVFGFFLFKNMVWDLADEVHDGGDTLIFRKGRVEQRVRLDEVINIDYARGSAPERVTVHCRNEGPLGKEVVFSLPARLNPFSKSTVASDLIERVDRLRRGK